MSPVKHHVLAAQEALREVKEYLRQDQHQLRLYTHELHDIYPPPNQFNRNDPKQRTAHLMYRSNVEYQKERIVATEDNITRWIYIKNKIHHRIANLLTFKALV